MPVEGVKPPIGPTVQPQGQQQGVSREQLDKVSAEDSEGAADLAGDDNRLTLEEYEKMLAEHPDWAQMFIRDGDGYRLDSRVRQDIAKDKAEKGPGIENPTPLPIPQSQ